MEIEDLKIQYVGQVPYVEDITVLQAQNKAFVKGQWILAEDSLGRIGIKIGHWDIKNKQPYDAAMKFNDSPWVLPPAASGVGGLNIIKVRTSNISGYPRYEVTGNNCIITDPRLIGVTDPLVSSSALGVDLRDENLTLDAATGELTISNFPGMDERDHIAIVVPSIIRPADSIGTLAERVTRLERAGALMASGSSIHIFRGTKEEVEAMPGFYILTETEGRTLFGFKEGDERFNVIWDTTGNKGHYEVPITEENIPAHNHMTTVDEEFSKNSRPQDENRVISNIRARIRRYMNLGDPGKEAYDDMGAAKRMNEGVDGIPNIGPTSYFGKSGSEFKNLNVTNPYITVWFLGYTPE